MPGRTIHILVTAVDSPPHNDVHSPIRVPPKESHVTRPVVLIAEELSPSTIDALGPDFEVRTVDGADRSQLLPALADVDAVLIRSATKMDAEAIAAAKNLTAASGQGEGQLIGVGASASAPPGPFSGSITGFANPTPGQNSSTANGTATGAAHAATTSGKSAAGRTEVGALTLFFAGLLGVALA